MAKPGLLTVDERFYLLAVEILGDLEGSDEKFAMYTALDKLIEHPRFTRRSRQRPAVRGGKSG